MSGVEIEAVVAAHLATPYHYVFRAAGNRATQLRKGLDTRAESIRSPCLFFIVRHPAHGVILIDTGLHPATIAGVRADYGLPMSLLFRGMEPVAAFDEQLRSRGIAPEEVERVVMTHLHVDHTGGMRLLPNATFTCAAPEWTAARSRLAALRGYVGHHLPAPGRVQLLDFAARGRPWGPFAGAIDLLGDGTIRALLTPGHTPGHISLLIEREAAEPVLVVGDAAYTLRSIHEEILPMITQDDSAARRSVSQIRSFLDANPHAIAIPTHDPDAWRQLGLAATT